MALAVNGSGTIFKKCDRSNHRPDSNKGCASSTCQHTCDNPERCQRAWTLRSLMPGARWRRDVPGKCPGRTLFEGLRLDQSPTGTALVRDRRVVPDRAWLQATCL